MNTQHSCPDSASSIHAFLCLLWIIVLSWWPGFLNKYKNQLLDAWLRNAWYICIYFFYHRLVLQACFCLRVPAVFMETPPSLLLRSVFCLLSQDLRSIKARLSSDTLFSFWSTGPHLSSLLPPAKCAVDLARLHIVRNAFCENFFHCVQEHTL